MAQRQQTSEEQHEDLPQRERIIRAATEVFREDGFFGARTRDIAERAGIKQPTLFHYFKTKEEIFYAAVFDPLDRAVSKRLMQLETITGEDERSRNRAFLAKLEEQLRGSIDSTPLLGVGLFSDPQRGKEFYIDRFLPVFERSVDLMEVALEQWHFEADPLLTLVVVWGMCYGVAIDAALCGIDVDVRKQAKHIGDSIYRGLR